MDSNLDSKFICIEELEKGNEDFSSIFNCKKSNDFEIVDDEQSTNSIMNNNIETMSYWDYLKKLFNDKKNILIFNYLPNQKKFNSFITKNIQIFSEIYDTNDEEFLNKFSNLTWFSYRNNFEPIIYNNNKITSDAGWGCMIRASQMFLAQAIYRLFNIKTLDDFLQNFIFLFLDNPIPIEYIHKKGMKLNKNKKIFINKNSSLFDSFESFGNNFIVGFEKMLEDENRQKINRITPPFSLRYICQINPKIGKNPGDWYSNYDLMNIFSEINEKFSPLNQFSNCDILFFNFPYGTIYLKKIIENCFEEIKCDCNFESYVKPDNIELTKEVNGFLVFDNKKEETNCNCFNNTIEIKNKKYKMLKKFIIFVSVRHGLRKINDSMKEQVLNIFDYKNNIGIIGGKETRALYFIGKYHRNLIFLDPHLVQQTYSINDFLVGNGLNTYSPNDIYYMSIDDMSPSFTIGFVFENIYDFIYFIKKSGENINGSNDDNVIRLSVQIDSLFSVKFQERVNKYDNDDPLISFYRKK